jgi:hypothetical protein
MAAADGDADLADAAVFGQRQQQAAFAFEVASDGFGRIVLVLRQLALYRRVAAWSLPCRALARGGPRVG